MGDPARELGDVLPGLRRDSDVVVLLMRGGLDEARELSAAAEELIDVVVVAPGKSAESDGLPEAGGSVYVRVTGRGQALGITRIAFDGEGIERIHAREDLLFPHVPEDKEVAMLVDTFLTNLNETLRENRPPRLAERKARDGHYYVGATACAECHAREYEIWQETPHASAFDTLVLHQSDALPECYGCHVTGSGDPVGYHPTQEQAESLLGVQCEVCHDKGTRHARDGSYGKSLLMDSCVTCHDEANSPEFDPHVYWLMMEH